MRSGFDGMILRRSYGLATDARELPVFQIRSSVIVRYFQRRSSQVAVSTAKCPSALAQPGLDMLTGGIR
jgi:hypothetical protein